MQESRTCGGAEHLFEGVTGHLVVGAQFSVQLARRSRTAPAQRGDHPQEQLVLALRCGPEALSGAPPRSTKIADPAGLLPVSKIAEVAHQAGHTALVAISVTDHLIDLRPFLLTLGDIGFAPLVVAAAHVLSVFHQGSAVGPELLESFVEYLFIHPELLLEGRLFLRLGPEPGEDRV